ncbi:MAG: iron ABC transporter permease [Thermoplasmata archaeon]|nr:iron ABC transporter permease [Thermoplasmata archaeon]
MSERSLEEYRSATGRRRALFLGGAILLLLLFLLSLSVGSARMGFSETLRTLLGGGDPLTRTIIFRIRLPRALTAIFAGIALAVSGAAMQSVLRNPLGSPFTLGISHASAFGAAFAIVVLGAGSLGSSAVDAVSIVNYYLVAISAFAFSLISTLAIVGLSRRRGATPEAMILTGVALGSLFTAAVAAIEYFADDVELSSIIFWTFGDVGRASFTDLSVIFVITLLSLAYFLLNRWRMSALDSGEDSARSLGVNVKRLRIVGMIVASLATATVVSFVGIIGFIGLIVPHMVRKIIGPDPKWLIPSSALLGAMLLLASDTLARTVISPIVLPVGIVTSFMGAPLFIHLVIKGREYW